MVNVKILNKSKWELPKYETNGAAGLDLRANIEDNIIIKPFERVLVPTGIYTEIPIGYEAQIRARSGLSIKHGITLVNAIGTIDSDYRGEWKIPLINLSNEVYTLVDGERIAQVVFSKYEKVEFITVSNEEELEKSKRGDGGFGSTGK